MYEYVNNGNLEQWLHGDVGPYSPLTWEIRMNIILGTAKGYKLSYFLGCINFYFFFILHSHFYVDCAKWKTKT